MGFLAQSTGFLRQQVLPALGRGAVAFGSQAAAQRLARPVKSRPAIPNVFGEGDDDDRDRRVRAGLLSGSGGLRNSPSVSRSVLLGG